MSSNRNVPQVLDEVTQGKMDAKAQIATRLILRIVHIFHAMGKLELELYLNNGGYFHGRKQFPVLSVVFEKLIFIKGYIGLILKAIKV